MQTMPCGQHGQSVNFRGSSLSATPQIPQQQHHLLRLSSDSRDHPGSSTSLHTWDSDKELLEVMRKKLHNQSCKVEREDASASSMDVMYTSSRFQGLKCKPSLDNVGGIHRGFSVRPLPIKKWRSRTNDGDCQRVSFKASKLPGLGVVVLVQDSTSPPMNSNESRNFFNWIHLGHASPKFSITLTPLAILLTNYSTILILIRCWSSCWIQGPSLWYYSFTVAVMMALNVLGFLNATSIFPPTTLYSIILLYTYLSAKLL